MTSIDIAQIIDLAIEELIIPGGDIELASWVLLQLSSRLKE